MPDRSMSAGSQDFSVGECQSQQGGLWLDTQLPSHHVLKVPSIKLYNRRIYLVWAGWDPHKNQRQRRCCRLGKSRNNKTFRWQTSDPVAGWPAGYLAGETLWCHQLIMSTRNPGFQPTRGNIYNSTILLDWNKPVQGPTCFIPGDTTTGF